MPPSSSPCLSLWQPWAQLIFEGVKIHETRSWPAPPDLVGRRLYIHAASRHVGPAEMTPVLQHLVSVVFADRVEPLAYGALLGSVRVIDCRRCEDTTPASREDEHAGNWARGRWAWLLGDPRAFAVPRPIRGQQRLWYCDRPELLREA